MKIRTLLYSVFSLPLIAFNASAARYNNDIPTCESLGYKLNGTVGCEFPIRCPFDSSYAVCVSNLCHGFQELEVLENEYKKLGKSLSAMCSKLETCEKGGSGSTNKIITYRCAKCNTDIFDAGICLDKCDPDKFPYSEKPEELYGHIISCTDTINGTRYAYDYCNDGWLPDEKGVRCDMTVADRKAYPYDKEPPVHRGKIEHFKSATSFYYGYSECYGEYSLDTYSSEYTTGSCIKKCAISSCTKQSDNSYRCTLQNSDDCMVGDDIMYGNTKVGVLLYKAKNSSEHNLLISSSSVSKSFGLYGKNFTTDLAFGTGKSNTQTALSHCEAENFSCDAVKYCNSYSVNNTHAAFGSGQWFLGSLYDMEPLANSNYTSLFEQRRMYNVSSDLSTSSNANAERTYKWINYKINGEMSKSVAGQVFPILEF